MSQRFVIFFLQYLAYKQKCHTERKECLFLICKKKLSVDLYIEVTCQSQGYVTIY